MNRLSLAALPVLALACSTVPIESASDNDSGSETTSDTGTDDETTDAGDGDGDSGDGDSGDGDGDSGDGDGDGDGDSGDGDGDGDGDSGDGDGDPGLMALDCSEEANLQSTDSMINTSINWINVSGEIRKTSWLNYQGARVEYAILQPDEQYEQGTFATHPWVVTDENDNCTQIFMPEDMPADAYLY